jgi:hypothetical protein
MKHNRTHYQRHRRNELHRQSIFSLIVQTLIIVNVSIRVSRIRNSDNVDAYILITASRTGLLVTGDTIRRHRTKINSFPSLYYRDYSNIAHQQFQRSKRTSSSLSSSQLSMIALQSLPNIQVWDESKLTITIFSSILSAATSYLSLIAYYDRPRGQLYVNCNNTEQLPIIQTRISTIIPNGGLGVYCTVPMIPKGTILGTYPGVVIPIQHGDQKLRQYPFCETYVWRFSDNQYIIDPTNQYGTLDDVCYGGNPSMIASIWLHQTIVPFIMKLLLLVVLRIDDTTTDIGISNITTTTISTNQSPFLKSTLLCRINEPPLGYDVNVYTNENIQDRTVSFITERDIYNNEELFIDYGLYYDRSNYV